MMADHIKADFERADAVLEHVYRVLRDDGHFEDREAAARQRIHELEHWMTEVFKAVRGAQ